MISAFGIEHGEISKGNWVPFAQRVPKYTKMRLSRDQMREAKRLAYEQPQEMKYRVNRAKKANERVGEALRAAPPKWKPNKKRVAAVTGGVGAAAAGGATAYKVKHHD